MIFMNDADRAIDVLKSIRGIGKSFVVLGDREKKEIVKLREKGNVVNRGVTDAFSREITIAFSHSEEFRPPPCAIVLLSRNGKIIGELTDTGKMFYGGAKDFDTYVLPPVMFAELEGEFCNVCSASPGYEADAYIRTLMRVKKNDATLLAGFNVKR